MPIRTFSPVGVASFYMNWGFIDFHGISFIGYQSSTPQTAMNDTHFDVLVVGMGPAGLMCALSLAKAGIRTKIIDRR